MVTRFSTIDLSQLPPPQVIDSLDFQVVKAARIALVQQLWEALRQQNSSLPALDTLSLESEPITVVLEADSYRELLLRGEINDKCRALLLAEATGGDLDQIGAFYDVQRMVVTPADNTKVPVVPAVMEDDERFRKRIQLAPNAFSTAGPWGAYVYWALTSDISIVDANAIAPDIGGVSTGKVNVYVAGANGLPVDDSVVLKLFDLLHQADVIPLTDYASVIKATVVPYDATLNLFTQRGPDPALIRASATTDVRSYANGVYKIGQTAFANAILASAKVGGVLNLTAPGLADIVCDGTQVPWLRNLTINVTQL